MTPEPPSQSILLCAIGDSRTFGAGATIGCDPLSNVAKLLQAEYPAATIAIDNQGINGTTSQAWLFGGILEPALSSFASHAAAMPAGAAVYVQIMLGVNDASGFGFGRCPLPNYLAQMQGIILAIQSAGIRGLCGIVLHSSFYAVPYGFAPEIDETCLAEVQRFNSCLSGLVDNTTVFLGDQDAYACFEEQPGLMFDKLHASNEGNAVLGALWVRAYKNVFRLANEKNMSLDSKGY